MIKLTCCRIGKYPKYNYRYKGWFTKEFKTLDKMAMWLYKSKNNFILPNIKKELTKNQIRILNCKLSALSKKYGDKT